VVTWTGGNIGGTNVTIKLSYTGSAAGIQAVAGNIPVRFLPDGLSGSGQTDVTAAANLGATADVHVPDFTFADEFQASTPWIGTNNLASTAYSSTGATYNNPQTYQTLIDNVVGILPLRIVASPGTPFTNITHQLAQQVFKYGGYNSSAFTANPSDTGTVYGLGRDIGSGARTLWLAESGIGTNTIINQYSPNVSVVNVPLVKIVPFAGGSGYGVAPTVKLSDTYGSGYTATPTVTFTGGLGVGGTGATATANVVGQKVTSVTLNTAGSGYTSAPTISFTGTTPTTAATAYATINTTTHTVTGVYVSGGATATATVSGGKVTGYTVTNGGSGYSAAPTLTLTSNDSGSGAYGTPVIAGGSITSNANATVLYPTQNLIGVHTALGDGGYSTFGPLLSAVTATPPAGTYFISAVADADAQTALAAGAVELAWEGNYLGTLGTSGTASPALANGQYTLWGYIRVDNLSTISGIQASTETAIINQLLNSDSQVLLQDVNVQRAQDGGQVVQGSYGN
jgi:hypothetical protein